MAKIELKALLNLTPAGTDLFNDAESFIMDLSEGSEQVIGGGTVNVWSENTYCK